MLISSRSQLGTCNSILERLCQSIIVLRVFCSDLPTKPTMKSSTKINLPISFLDTESYKGPQKGQGTVIAYCLKSINIYWLHFPAYLFSGIKANINNVLVVYLLSGWNDGVIGIRSGNTNRLVRNSNAASRKSLCGGDLSRDFAEYLGCYVFTYTCIRKVV